MVGFRDLGGVAYVSVSKNVAVKDIQKAQYTKYIPPLHLCMVFTLNSKALMTNANHHHRLYRY